MIWGKGPDESKLSTSKHKETAVIHHSSCDSWKNTFFYIIKVRLGFYQFKGKEAILGLCPLATSQSLYVSTSGIQIFFFVPMKQNIIHNPPMKIKVFPEIKLWPKHSWSAKTHYKGWIPEEKMYCTNLELIMNELKWGFIWIISYFSH